MQKIKSFAAAIFFGIAAIGLTPVPAMASVMYSYTGSNFNSIFDSPIPAGSYDTTMSVSGSFTVANALGSNLPSLTDISALVLSFSFSDGRHTFDPSNTPFAVFTVGTDTAGAITTWQIYLEGDDLPDLLGDQYYELVTVYPGPLDPLLYPAADTGTLFECVTPGPEFCYTETDYAQVLNDPGTWTSHVDVPEPSSMLLVGAGLAGLAGFGRRRRQV